MNLRRRLLPPALIAPLVALLLASVVVSLTTARFVDTQNFVNLALQVSIVAIMAIGSTIVILTGGIDLSAGSMVAVLTMLMAMFITENQLPLGVAILLTILIGSGLGAINGLLVAYVRIPSFIATLATLSVFKGWAFLYNNGAPIFSVSPDLEPIFYDAVLGIPLPLFYVLGCFALAYLFLTYTAPGRAVYAVGGNESAARFSGINVRRVRMIAFTLAGTTAGISSVLMAARLNSGSPNYGAGMELEAIGAAVIGGASLAGGYGNIVATLIGALTIVVVQNGLNLNAVATPWQMITLGVIIALAVGFDSWRGAMARMTGRLLRRPPAAGEVEPSATQSPTADGFGVTERPD
ncbi:MAG TPA: ABC transporter permease [Patescibacteria group bacterium]|nr:ABC transporter permease [Patescibacteria group bacterium]